MMNLAEYRRTLPRASPTFFPGPRWSPRRRSQQGWQLSAHGTVSRAGSRFRDTGRTGRRHRPAQQCAPPSRLRLGDLRRGAAPARPQLSRQRFPGSGVEPGRRERRAQFEEEGAHFESPYFLTLLYLPPAEDAARAEGLLYEGRDRRRDADVGKCDGFRRPHRPRARACRGLYARGLMAR